MEHTYSIATDTANAKVETYKLVDEISSSSIIPSLDRIDTEGDDLKIYFTSALSAGEITTLTGLVNSHDGEPIPKSVDPIPVDVIDHSSATAPKFQVVEPTGRSMAYVSHDFTDKTTWYTKSVRVTGETLSGSGTGPYTSANTNWIDLTHGKHAREDLISATYIPVIYDDGVEISDYTIDYAAGTVTLDSAPSGSVTADYSYENGSCWALVPNSGKTLRLEHAELDFSVDVTMSEVHFEVWAYNPADLPNKMLIERVTYKNEKDILKIANSVQQIEPWGALVKATKRAEFEYGRTIDLQASTGAELRIVVESESPFTKVESSSFGTVTFYTIEEDE